MPSVGSRAASTPSNIADPGETLRTYLPGHTLRFGLIRDHSSEVLRAAGQVGIKLVLVVTSLWRGLATSLNAFPAGLGVNFTYRPERSIATPAYELLRGVGALREGLAAAARFVSRLTSANQRVAFRVHKYVLERRRPNYPG